eukprot:scaffold291713_cov14-Tisochrysis_lutea.AAC.1
MACTPASAPAFLATLTLSAAPRATLCLAKLTRAFFSPLIFTLSHTLDDRAAAHAAPAALAAAGVAGRCCISDRGSGLAWRSRHGRPWHG